VHQPHPENKRPGRRNRGARLEGFQAESVTTNAERKSQILPTPWRPRPKFVCRLPHQQEFPRQLIREELVRYEALLKTNGRPFRKHRFIERLLAARGRLKSESAPAEAIGAALFALKGKPLCLTRSTMTPLRQTPGNLPQVSILGLEILKASLVFTVPASARVEQARSAAC
jgi:hypothetical protein